MRYLCNKIDDNDDIRNFAKEYMMKPLSANGISPVNVVTNQPNSTEQVYAQMGQQINQNGWLANNAYSLDTYHFVYQIEAKVGQFVLFYGENVVKYLQRTTTRREQNNLKGGLSHTSTIKDKPIEVCDPIFFKSVDRFQREDKPRKHFYNVFFTLNSCCDRSFENVIIEEKELNSKNLCLKLKGEIVKVGQEALCSEFFRSEINRLAKFNIEIMIPLHPGWYNDERYGWMYLSREKYIDLKDHEIPAGMNRRIVGRTKRSVNVVYNDCKSVINSEWYFEILLAVVIISILLIMLEKEGIEPMQIIVPKVSNQEQISIIIAILKTCDFASLKKVSLGSYESDVNDEMINSQDGIAVILGPLTAAESKINRKQAHAVRDAAIGANVKTNKTRCLIALISRFFPAHISPEFILPIDCTHMNSNVDVKRLRDLILEFEAAVIEYIERNFDKVEGIISSFVSKYREYPDTGIIRERENLYIMLLGVQEVMKECFGIELFDDDSFVQIRKLFTEVNTEALTPDENVRDEFVDAASEIIMEGKFNFMDISQAHKSFRKGENTLIVDKKKGFLSFEMSSLNKIAERMNSVRNGAELANVLKQCGAMKCPDNGGRQITVPHDSGSSHRPAFYSVYISEFGDEIMNVINFSENLKFFILPEKTLEGFIPLVWYKGHCAGIVLGGEGLPNSHFNISGMSGLGKNRGTFRIAESCLRLGAKVIFIDVKGGCSDKQLSDMNCDLQKYHRSELKTEGLPYNIFDLTAFNGKNAKAGYILNLFSAAVPKLTQNQMDELSSYVYTLIGDNTEFFSFDDLKAKFPKNRQTALEKKLMPFYKIMSSYEPKEGKYQYNSCSKFFESNERITILSLVQASDAELRCIVYALMSSIYAHQVCDSSIPLILVADEMQHYELNSPFCQWVSEGRQYGISVWGITQEYLSKGNDTRKFMSNAACNIFYGATNDSSKRVVEALNNRYTHEEVETKGVGSIIVKGYFWDPIEGRHMPIILEGQNDNC